VEVAEAEATAAVSAAAVDFTAVVAFTVAASAAVDFAAVTSVAAGFTAVDFAAAGFAEADFAEIGFIMATSTTGFSSLTVMETRSFTIHIHTTDIIPTVTTPTTIIRMAMVTVIIRTAMDTVVFVAAGMAFIGAVFTAVALMPTVLTVMAPTVINDSYNEDVHQCRAAHTKADPL